MRYALALLTLTVPLLAQQDDGAAGRPATEDSAASLFYRAFWLEQAGRKAEEAEKLYAQLIKKYADAPETPRAYVALIRLRAARGAEVADLVSKLEKNYPKLVREIECARDLAARLRSDFEPGVKPDDTPVVRKLKGIYSDMFRGAIRSEDIDFLSDIGAVGHPMLARVLRSPNSGAVKKAASLLVNQRTKEANAVVTTALRDPTILYRMTIVDRLRILHSYDPDLMKTLREIWPQASRSMRRRIASTWAVGTLPGAPTKAQCYEYLAMAVGDEDPGVRRAAASLLDAETHEARPEAYVAAVLPLCLKGDAAMERVWQWLPWQLQHAELAPRIIDALGAYDGRLNFHGPGDSEKVDDAVAIAMARMAIARYESGRPAPPQRDSTNAFATLAARSSGTAAGLILDAAMRLGRSDLAMAGGSGVQSLHLYGSAIDKFIVAADKLRARAIEQSYDGDYNRRLAADAALVVLGLRAADLASVIRMAKAHPDRGLIRIAMQDAFLRELGAERAAELIPVAAPQQLDELLAYGMNLWNGGAQNAKPEAERDHGDPFWAAMLERYRPTPSYWQTVYRLPKMSAALAELVAGWTLDRKDKEFRWSLPGQAPNGSGSGEHLLKSRQVRAAFRRAPLRDRLFAMAADERREIGKIALRTAAQEPGEAALVAYRKALDSPWDDVVRESLHTLPKRKAEGAAILADYLRRPKLGDDRRRDALQAFFRSDATDQLPYVLERLDARCDGYEAVVMWPIAFKFDRDATVERALKEVYGVGSPDFRTAALGVLTRSSDARRIPVFRKVLCESKDTDRVHAVLRTVASQYLIELGPEVLLHLRSPDDTIRNTATKAIERLRFYVEAKKLFDKEGDKDK